MTLLLDKGHKPRASPHQRIGIVPSRGKETAWGKEEDKTKDLLTFSLDMKTAKIMVNADAVIAKM